MSNPFASMIQDTNKVLEESKNSHDKLPITREEAIKMIDKYDQEDFDKKHYLESEAVLRGIAKHLGEDEDYYGMLGLLHDIDWAITKQEPTTHLTKTQEILEEKGFDQEFIDIVISHGYGFDCAGLQDKVRTEKIQHCLAAGETITGLIHSYALMRDRRVSDMEVKGLKKKFKDKTFAKGVNREVIREIEKVGIELSDFFKIAIDSISGIKDVVGLE
jgi:putative nucleotidyltransferase with HDIG domain